MKPADAHAHPATDTTAGKQVQADISYDVEQLDGCKLYRTLLVAQVSKRNALKRIERYYQHHHGNVIRMIGILQQSGDRMQKNHTKHHKEQRQPSYEYQ